MENKKIVKCLDNNIIDVGFIIEHLNCYEFSFLLFNFIYLSKKLTNKFDDKETKEKKLKLSNDLKINKETKIKINKLSIKENENDLYNQVGNSESYKKELNELKKLLQISLSEKQYNKVIKKLESVSIIEDSKRKIKKVENNLLGYYLITKHELHFTKRKKFSNHKNSTLYHELLHASSSEYNEDENICLSGIERFYNNKNIIYATALNEGYTEHLNKELFGINNNSYKYFENVASIINDLLDDKVSSYYFDNDLYGLVKELAKYSSKEKVEELIKKTDFLLEYNDIGNNIKYNEKKQLNEYYNSIQKLLLECFYNKMNIDMKYNKKLYLKILNLQHRKYFTINSLNEDISQTKNKILGKLMV